LNDLCFEARKGEKVRMAENKDSKDQESDLVSYCGLYCLDCPLFLGIISDISRDLRKELRRVEYDRFAKYVSKFPAGKKLKDFEKCYDGLGAMMKFRCEKGCRKGGGTENCQIRQCCQEKELEGCWQCTNYERCEKLDALNALHRNAHRKNLRIIQEKGLIEFTKGDKHWYS
jgi:hypothetical protein